MGQTEPLYYMEVRTYYVMNSNQDVLTSTWASEVGLHLGAFQTLSLGSVFSFVQ